MGGDKIVEFSMLEKVKFYGKEEENEFSKCTPKQWSQRGDTVVQDAQAGSEPPRKGCADIWSQVTEALTWAICQGPDPNSSQLPVLSLGASHSSNLRPSGPRLCLRNGFPPTVHSTSLNLDDLRPCHWVNSGNSLPYSGLHLLIYNRDSDPCQV